MSKMFLLSFCRGKRGKFYEFVNSLNERPSIAWYPSGDADFHPLIYLSENFARQNNLLGQLPAPPDLFIYTDYSASSFYHMQVVEGTRFPSYHTYPHTEIIVELAEQLNDLELEPICFRQFGLTRYTNKVYFLVLRVNSPTYGVFKVPLLYAFVENGAFFKNKLLGRQDPLIVKTNITHIVHKNWGGGPPFAFWMMKTLRRLKTKLIITDSESNIVEPSRECESFDTPMYEQIPRLRNERIPSFEKLNIQIEATNLHLYLPKF